MTTEFVKSLREISGQFDGFILDLWGVLHDGSYAYPGAIDALKNLRKENKKIILLSNAPRRIEKAQAVLDELGFSRDLYDHIITSGQVTYDYLRDQVSGFGFQEEGKTKPDTRHPTPYYYIGPEKDEDLLAGLENYKITDNPAEAKFALATGFDAPGEAFATKQKQIDACLKNNLQLVCANPDRVVVKQDGSVWLCAGLIYDYYLENGGKAIIFGKPYRQVYDRCLELFGCSVSDAQCSEKNTEHRAPSTEHLRICAIGDSIHTDVAGANNAGIYSVLCAGGILAKDLQIKFGEMPSKENLKILCDKDGAVPRAVVPAFTW